MSTSVSIDKHHPSGLEISEDSLPTSSACERIENAKKGILPFHSRISIERENPTAGRGVLRSSCIEPEAPPTDALLLPAGSNNTSRSGVLNDHTSNLYPLCSSVKDLHGDGTTTRKKKKRNRKKGAVAALNTVHGFAPVTSGSEDSDFSMKTFRSRQDLTMSRSSSLTSSPGLRSSSPGPGVSIITKQLEALDFESQFDRCSPVPKKGSKLRVKTGSDYLDRSQITLGSTSHSSSPSDRNSSATSDHMEKARDTKTVSYEVALEHDFVSPDVTQKDEEQSDPFVVPNHVVRKMTAADFVPLRCLGKGSYGTVHLVKQVATGKLYAEKQFKKASLTIQQQLVDQTKTERAILESINRHPYVVKLFYAFQDQEKLYLILEYAQGGELFTRMLAERMFPEDTAAFYMAEMVLALEHLHNTVGVVYRDLKPENCLLDADGHLLLTDFGLSKVAVDGGYRCRSMTGTLEYMAPEVILQKQYGPEVDWWSFGILAFDLLTGASPFYANNDAKIREKILKSKPLLPFFLSIDAKDLLTRLLRKKPSERLGASMPKDLSIIKRHRFFRKIDWAKLERRQLEPPIQPVITNPEMAENFSTEFTDLAVSPIRAHPQIAWKSDSATDPFGGFSFVASKSLWSANDEFF